MRAVLCSVLWARTNTLRLVITLQIISGRVFRSTLAMDDYKKKLKKIAHKNAHILNHKFRMKYDMKTKSMNMRNGKAMNSFPMHSCKRASSTRKHKYTQTSAHSALTNKQTNMYASAQVHDYSSTIDRQANFIYIYFILLWTIRYERKTKSKLNYIYKYMHTVPSAHTHNWHKMKINYLLMIFLYEQTQLNTYWHGRKASAVCVARMRWCLIDIVCHAYEILRCLCVCAAERRAHLQIHIEVKEH